MRSFLRAFRAPALALFVAACGGDARPTPDWVDLSSAYVPQRADELVASLEATLEAPREGRLVPGTSGESWFELPLPRALWSTGTHDCEWRAPRPTGGALALVNPTTLEIELGGQVWRPTKKPRPGTFLLGEDTLSMCFEDPAGPPEGLRLRGRIDLGRRVGTSWRVEEGDLACSGFRLVPGHPVTLRCELASAARLAFETVLPEPAAGTDVEPSRVRVRLDETTLLESSQAPTQRTLASSVVLQTSGVHTLRFEIEGPRPALVATPRLGPETLGAPGARPWSGARPDLVLILCDTFRADNLAAWGGAPEHAPLLNRFVESARYWREARSTAAWTLPSIGSILSGVYPGQHGGTDLDRAVVEAVETQAEVLARAGYRTAAVTDGGLFSRQYGQDQGFEWFEEADLPDWNLGATLERARRRLAADDGRPLFLVVHTYRVHGPMRWGPDEDPAPWQEILEGWRGKHREGPPRSGSKFNEIGRRFYMDAVLDLDRKIGAWLEELRAADFLGHGFVALTADHGNAYGENNQSGHGGDMYEIKLRVPLAIAGPGLAPGPADGPASLIDLAPTLADLAGVKPSPSWPGRSLLASPVARPEYAFDLKPNHPQIAVLEGRHKVLAPDLAALGAGQPTHAFDLATDPGEETNLATSLEWPAALGRTSLETLRQCLEPAGEARRLDLTPEQRDAMGALGYTGDGYGSDPER